MKGSRQVSTKVIEDGAGQKKSEKDKSPDKSTSTVSPSLGSKNKRGRPSKVANVDTSKGEDSICEDKTPENVNKTRTSRAKKESPEEKPSVVQSPSSELKSTLEQGRKQGRKQGRPRRVIRDETEVSPSASGVSSTNVSPQENCAAPRRKGRLPKPKVDPSNVSFNESLSSNVSLNEALSSVPDGSSTTSQTPSSSRRKRGCPSRVEGDNEDNNSEVSFPELDTSHITSESTPIKILARTQKRQRRSDAIEESPLDLSKMSPKKPRAGRGRKPLNVTVVS